MTVPELTATEQLIVLRVAAGASTHTIAEEIGVGQRTVEWHLARARRKLERASALHERVRAGRGAPDAGAEGETR